MRILGVDPGTITTGYGIIDFDKNEIVYIASGTIQIPITKDFGPRLEKIYDELYKIIKKYKPTEFALETAFYGKNVQSALKIGYARGVSLLAAVHNKLHINEYSPREIKKSIVGKGSSSKEQVQYMIKKICSIKKSKMKFDESDAIAVAVCHAFKIKSNYNHKRSKNWKEFIESNPERIIHY
ncbi:MAG: crossover junction endodeoxyribonuclease RuvC [Melioribacter sp.]|uniref:crossover junction endodeoxyribonuclease RuvC n=1 Tax=Rosettibacter primus TaxID=3111523 RepID=UPI00247D6FE5|nr:crossover junction endodeoxyribonuclease RuvC [Melioribacter sp.]